MGSQLELQAEVSLDIPDHLTDLGLIFIGQLKEMGCLVLP